MGISVALTSSTHTVTVSKSMITNASFRTKKLPGSYDHFNNIPFFNHFLLFAIGIKSRDISSTISVRRDRGQASSFFRSESGIFLFCQVDTKKWKRNSCVSSVLSSDFDPAAVSYPLGRRSFVLGQNEISNSAPSITSGRMM